MATLEDYAVVRELVIEALSEGVEAIVPTIVRETVEAIPDQLNSFSVTELAELLHLDKSSASRRVQQALELGYLANDEERRALPRPAAPKPPASRRNRVAPHLETLQRCIDLGPTPNPPPPDAENAAAVGEPAVTAETIEALIERMPELADWPRDQLQLLAPDLLRAEAEHQAEQQHRDPHDGRA